MTSRDYIYNRARQELKDGAFPLLNESQVVIDVHDLSDVEKQLILYNHLKLGKQSATFRFDIKPKTGANSSNTYDLGGLPILVIAGKLILHLY